MRFAKAVHGESAELESRIRPAPGKLNIALKELAGTGPFLSRRQNGWTAKRSWVYNAPCRANGSPAQRREYVPKKANFPRNICCTRPCVWDSGTRHSALLQCNLARKLRAARNWHRVCCDWA